MTYATDIATGLLEIEAIQIDLDYHFTWTSGLKAPIYCDNRLIMSHPRLRKQVTDAFIAKIKQMEQPPELIAGCATAGISHAAWLSDALGLPMVYVRDKPKEHGKGNQIEGWLQPGQNTIIIEDLISTGASSIETAKALKKAGAHVLGVMGIFSYGLTKAANQYAEAGIPASALTDLDRLLALLETNRRLPLEHKETLLKWRDTL